MNKRKRMKSVLWLACIFLLTGCTLKSQNSTVTMEQTDLQKEEIIFDSLDTAIVLAVERENEIIQFQNIETGKLYSLSWNGATFFYDKYNQPITNQQIKVGDVVEKIGRAHV